MGVFCFLVLVPDRQPIVVPVQQFDAVTSAIEEQEQVTREQLDLEVLSYQARESVKTLSHIGVLIKDEDAHPRSQCDHR